MTTITATDSAPGFDMFDNGFVRWNGAYLYAFGNVFAYEAGDTNEDTYAPQNVIIYGSGFTYDGVKNPTGGLITAININIDNNKNVAGVDIPHDVFITPANGISWPLTMVMPAGSNADVAASTFWETLLSGDDTILAPRAGSASLTGDFIFVLDAEQTGGNDSFSTDGNPFSSSRDVFKNVMVGDSKYVGSLTATGVGVLHGGADSFTLTGAQKYSVVGDALDVGPKGIVYGGADTIVSTSTTNISFSSEVFFYAGDASFVMGRLLGGADTITGADALGDLIVGDAYGLSLYQSIPSPSEVVGGNDLLAGLKGDDRLTGDVYATSGGTVTGGNDTLDGGLGNDTLSGDVDSQAPGIYGESSVSHGGNDLLDGGDGDDKLYGDVRDVRYFGATDGAHGGKDTLLGGAGNDLLAGDVGSLQAQFVGSGKLATSGGDDWLDGGTGADTMQGGGGSDGYVVDDIGDRVDESGGDGIDTVYSGVDFDFTAGTLLGVVENLTLMGAANIGVGNNINNALIGNDMANMLKGLGGDDFLRGGLGKDKIDGGLGNDTADYGERTETVSVTLKGTKAATVKLDGVAEDRIKSVEHLIGGSKADAFGGDSAANALRGGGGRDSLTGGSGDDTLNGGKGNDQLRGDDGKDVFVFDFKLGARHADTIADFKHNTDVLALDDAFFAAIGSKLNKGEFYAKAGATRAHDANDHIIYNSANGRLYYDADGKDGKAAVLFATLSGHPGLDHGDFAIV